MPHASPPFRLHGVVSLTPHKRTPRLYGAPSGSVCKQNGWPEGQPLCCVDNSPKGDAQLAMGPGRELPTAAPAGQLGGPTTRFTRWKTSFMKVGG